MLHVKLYQLTNKQTFIGFAISLLFCTTLFFISPFVESETSHVNSFQKTLHKKEREIEKLIQNIAQEIEVNSYDNLFKTQLSSFESLYDEKGFVLLVYQNDSLKFWSDNHIPVENFLLKVCLDSKIVKLNNGLFEVRRKEVNNKIIIGLILIKNDYSFNNEYLNDEFAIGFHLPSNTAIADDKANAAHQIFSKENHYLF